MLKTKLEKSKRKEHFGTLWGENESVCVCVVIMEKGGEFIV